MSQAQIASAIDLGTGATYHNHRFEAWGTSLAWWGNEVGGQSNAQGREDLIDIFFDPTNGLGLNFVRYNIGAGSNPDTSVQNITRPGAKMDGWVPDQPSDFSDTSTWVWDWNADATQRLILDMAIEHGVTQVEAFANSAPWWLTRNEKSNGTSGGGSNLSTARDDEFAYYMLEVVDHFSSNLGIHFETLAPMNEPGSGFWNGSSNQEGMGVPAGFYQDALIKTFGAEIDNRGVDIKLVGLEETSTDQSADSWTNSSLTDTAKEYIKQVNTHTYSFNGGSLQSDSERLFDAVQADGFGQKIYATEYGTGNGAVRMATQIHRDIRYLDAAGWTYWQAIEDNNGSGWGLAISNFNGTNPRFDVQDQYFALKQFSAFIRPGSEIIEIDGQEEVMTAAYDPRTGKTVVIVTNDGADADSESYSFDLLDRDVLSTRLIRTTDESNSLRTDAYASLGPAAATGNNITFDAVGNAVTSVVIHHRPNLISNANFDPNGLPDNSPQFDDWQAEGNVVFDTGADNTGDGSGSAQLQTNTQGNSGKIFQTGIGDADTDLTGVAYQLSVDMEFRNSGSSQYDADTYLALEFYGADDETLASVSLNDYETEIEPAFAVKRDGFNSSVDGSDPNDSVYRVFMSERFVAPEGTRYVRPVVRFDGVESGSNSVLSVDNIHLQEVHPEAAAREWNAVGGGNWSDDDSWLNHSLVENNSHAYFGNAIDEDALVLVNDTREITGLTFFSDHAYRVRVQTGSAGKLELGNSNAGENGLIDVRWGSHRISTDTLLTSDLDLQVLPDASVQIDNGFDLNGFEVRKLGAGTVNFALGLNLNGGTLSAYASADSTITLGADAILDGDYELLLAPGQELELGDTFELATYASLNDTFDEILLPTLTPDLAWEVEYGANVLTAEVVAGIEKLLGDYNGDGFVSQADLDMVLLNWGDSTPPPGFVEFNLDSGGPFDGSMSQNELDGVLLKWGSGSPSASAIPEPTSVLVLAMGGLAISQRRRR